MHSKSKLDLLLNSTSNGYAPSGQTFMLIILLFPFSIGQFCGRAVKFGYWHLPFILCFVANIWRDQTLSAWLHRRQWSLRSCVCNSCVKSFMPHGEWAIGFLPCRVPDLSLDCVVVLKSDKFGCKFDCDCWHDVGGYFIASEGVDDVGFACSCITYEDNWVIVECTLEDIAELIVGNLLHLWFEINQISY